MRDIKVSIVIPTYNEEKYIGTCLSSIKNGSVTPLEIIVADGGSSDKTVKIAKKMGAIVIDNPLRHAAGGRNEGIKVAKGNVIAFIDADCIADKKWLEEIKKSFENDNIDGLGTYIEPAEFENKYEQFWGIFSLKELMTYGIEPYYVRKKTLNDAFITASCAYTKELLEQLNGFDNWFANNAEDIDICWRAIDAGAKLKYEPKAKIKAHSPTDIKGIKRKSFRNGYSSSKLQKRYGSFFNYDLNIYKALFSNLGKMIAGRDNAYLYVIEILWHLAGKYYGSFKVGIINI